MFQSAYSKGHSHHTAGKLPHSPLCLFAKNNLSSALLNVAEPASKVQLILNKLKHEVTTLLPSLKTKPNPKHLTREIFNFQTPQSAISFLLQNNPYLKKKKGRKKKTHKQTKPTKQNKQKTQQANNKENHEEKKNKPKPPNNPV